MWRFKTLILILGLMSSIVHAMRFDIQSGNTKCITEDIKTNAMTVGKYIVVNPNEGYPMPDTHKITVRVTSLQGNNYHYGDHVETGTFAFTAAEAGDYMACFWVPDHKEVMTVSVDFDWKSGVAAKDWSKVAKKGQVEVRNLIHFFVFFSAPLIWLVQAFSKKKKVLIFLYWGFLCLFVFVIVPVNIVKIEILLQIDERVAKIES
ncbi:hypothetical protein F0562_004392 [Nyssa sinensis]|uniref:GOLD domain-containing protein n=1 Tax=Nyssa sinensis TaxID=561372 RepID=A0A5J5BXQ6_9ASTE|nr:hypothetical protein F0562_004392 [Nyssa sinensis]